MKRAFRAVHNFLIDPNDIRVSIFNIMATVGGSVSLIAFIVSAINGVALSNLAALLFSIVVSFTLLHYSKRTGKYRVCYLLTIIMIFMIMFPVMFFTAGGLHSGMPIYFVFAVTYTVFMLENKLGLIISAVQLIGYIVCCLVALYHPSVVIPFPDETAEAMDIISCTIVCSLAMAGTVFVQTGLYHKEQKKTEAALEEVRFQSQTKDIFLANMSHEIRTPINIILGMSEMINRTSTEEQVLGFNQKIRLFGKKLLIMIRDVIDITKIQTGKTELETTVYRLEEIVTELEMLGDELASEKKISFIVKREFENSLTLVGDKAHFLEIVSNLVTNAVKYTEQGHVTLTVHAEKKYDKNSLITVSVEDTGIGIPEDEISNIFEIFYRTEKCRSVEGTGIGLAIVKELTERMNGKISVDSAVGKGTTFTLEISQGISEKTIEERKRTEIHYIAPDCRILMVDDNPENLQLLKTLLGRTMLQIDTAESGAEGIKLAMNKSYDIIILDYMMPEMNGIETLARMKQNGIDTAFIALTADAIAGTCAKMLEAGFSEYVTKPVEWSKFEQVLLKYIPKEKVAFESSKQNSVSAEEIASLAGKIENCELDIAYGLRRVDNSKAIYQKILLLFCSHYEKNHGKASELLESADWQGLRIVVHSLKGQARGIGGELLAHMAEVTEKKLMQNDVTYVRSAFPLLMLQWERTREQAKQLSELLPASEDRAVTENTSGLLEQAVHALQNNLWLNAREAVEALQSQNDKEPVYGEILQLIEKFEFTKALELLEEGVKSNECT